MSGAWPWLAGNLEALIAQMSPQEFVKQPRIIETVDGTTRTLMLAEFYKRLLPMPGGVVVLGVRYGSDWLSLCRMRSIFEPANQLRLIVGFDTFEGHRGHTAVDGDSEHVQDGALSVPEEWDKEVLGPLAEAMLNNDMGGLAGALVKGVAPGSVHHFLETNPQFMPAGIVVDFDLFEPTYETLMAFTPRMVPGVVLWWDELGASNYPGEAVALRKWMQDTGIELSWWRPPWGQHEALATVESIPW